MTTGYPTSAMAEAPSGRLGRAPKVVDPAATSAVRYSARRNSRTILFAAIAISVLLHGALLLGTRWQKKAVAATPKEEINLIRLAIPELKELEEPEPAPFDGDAPPPDPGVLVPMQADVPQLARPTDFVQQLNFASLLEQPDFSKLSIYVVPENIQRSGRNLAEQFGRIFNLDDLDRVPEPVLQPAPAFPVALRREVDSARVVIEFIVDVHGRVLHTVVIESTHVGFEDPALRGVSRWKFRAGVKAGRKVNTRMRVPILFRLLDSLDS